MGYQRSNSNVAPASVAGCPLRTRLPVVLDAIRHPVMRRLSDELLAAGSGCWTVAQPEPEELLVEAIARITPDVLVVDTVDFPACCLEALDALPAGRVVVIGPEPDPAYSGTALAQGAAGWVSREHVGDQLCNAVRSALRCPAGVCLPDMPCDRSSPSSRSEPARAGQRSSL